MKQTFKIVTSAVETIAILMFSITFALPTMNGADAPNELKSVSSHVLGVVEIVGYAISIGMLLYLSIKYMMAPANERANLKNASVKYVAGAVIIGGATAILQLIANFSDRVAG